MKKVILSLTLLTPFYKLLAPPKKIGWIQIASQSDQATVVRNTDQQTRVGDLGIRKEASLNEQSSSQPDTLSYGPTLIPKIILNSWLTGTIDKRTDETLTVLRDNKPETWLDLDHEHIRPDRIERALEKLLKYKDQPEEERYLGFAQNTIYLAQQKGHKSNYIEQVLQWNKSVSIKKCQKLLDLIDEQYKTTQTQIEFAATEYENKIKKILKQAHENTNEELTSLKKNRSLYHFILTLGSQLQSDTESRERENLSVLKKYESLVLQLAHYRTLLKKKVTEFKSQLENLSQQSSKKNSEVIQELKDLLGTNDTE